MKNYILLILVLALGHGIVFSQNEASFWYFGRNAGLQFNSASGQVTALTNGKINTLEGCTSISDRDGVLQFYSDGRTVYNRNHSIMQNGTGLKGDPSSTSSGLIVPKPQDSNFYYLFTVDEPHHQNAQAYPNQFNGTYDSGGSVPDQDDGFNNGINYTLIDMRLDGGIGGIVLNEKNVPLITYDQNDPEEIKYKCSEKITAVKADDCSSFWVLSHFVNKFYAYKIDVNGVSTTPIISEVGPTVPISGYRRNSLGYLKASPDGKKLAVAHYGFATNPGGNAPGGVYLFDFDSNTGQVSNSIELYGPDNNNSPYGIEFSAENKKLYASIGVGPAGNQSSLIRQWDLESGDIVSSGINIHNSASLSAGALQLGIDKKIYRAQLGTNPDDSRYLGVISKPEEDGLNVIYSSEGILLDLSGNFQNISTIGLPPFIQSLFNSEIDIIKNDVSTTELQICEGETYTLQADEFPDAVYTWFKDNQLLSESSFQLSVDSEGFYQVLIEPNNGDCPIEGRAIVQVSTLPDVQSASIFQCDEVGAVDGLTIFNLNELNGTVSLGESNRAVSYYLSLSDAQSDSSPISADNFSNTQNPQLLFARIENTITGCFNTAEIILETSDTSINISTLEVCDDDGVEDGLANFDLSSAKNDILEGIPIDLDLSFFESIEDALLEQNTLPNFYQSTIPWQQTIFVRGEDSNNCYGISELQLTVLGLPDINTEAQAFYCLNTSPEPITLFPGLNDNSPSLYAYEWSTGETSSKILVNQPGTYSVKVFNSNGCFKERFINVEPSNTATLNSVDVIDATENNSISFTVSGEGDYEFALNNITGPYQDQPFFDQLTPNLYTLFIRDKNGCGIVSKEISVLGFPKFFTPNGDGINDLWQIKGIQSREQVKRNIQIFDRYGKLIAEINPISLGWDGSYNGTQLPSSDYWFNIQLEDGRKFTSHFTLKR